MSSVLQQFNRSMKNVASVIGDNWVQRECIAENSKVPLIGWSSHRFSLCVCQILSHDKHMVEKNHQLIVKFRTHLLSEKLRKQTGLQL